jgi:protein phosphatase
MSTLTYAALSDAGRQHTGNEDRWLADPKRGIYLVSDGMAEDISPQMVVDTLPGLLEDALAKVTDLTDPGVAETVRSVLVNMSVCVRDASRKRQDMLGATLVLVLIRQDCALLAHLGDSRIYLFREGSLEQLTRDHSFVQRMVDLGQLTPEEAAQWSYNGGPTQFLGMPGKAEVEVRVLRLQGGDQLLLCSDGLTCMLADADLLAIFARRLKAQETCRQLIDTANTAGGEDNITVLLICV